MLILPERHFFEAAVPSRAFATTLMIEKRELL